MTRPYAEVIGDPIAQSKSPLIHSFWLDALGIDAEYRHKLVTAEDLPAYFAERKADPAWRGCNITMPHKIVPQTLPGSETWSSAAILCGIVMLHPRQAGSALRSAK
jgi:shikimate 5-dehydrogenase